MSNKLLSASGSNDRNIIFELSGELSVVDQAILAKNTNNASITNGNDIFHYCITFKPPLTKRDASISVLSATYRPAKQCFCRIVVLPNDNVNKDLAAVGPMRFIAFETHAVQLLSNGNIGCVWITLENNLLRGPTKSNPKQPDPILNPCIDPTHFIQSKVGKHRYTGAPLLSSYQRH
jgi:hypothetical protein